MSSWREAYEGGGYWIVTDVVKLCIVVNIANLFNLKSKHLDTGPMLLGSGEQTLF